MSGSSFGKLFTVTTFGESHGAALGCIIDGVPAGIRLDLDEVQAALDRRKPGQSANGKNNASVTARKEDDRAQFLSGVFEGVTEGTPIAIVIQNTSQHSKDYGNLASTFRPGHADLTYFLKYGTRDYRGGGRSSGRETAARVAAGAVAIQVIKALCPDVKITAYTEQAAGVKISKIDLSQIEQNPLRAPDNEAAALMNSKIEEIRSQKNTAGGVIACSITGIPAGLGEPVFDKADAVLSHAVMSIGAVKGIEFGAGFEVSSSTGLKNNDKMQPSADKKSVEFITNNAGGILGGISTGAEIFFRAAVKPVPSVYASQDTVQWDGGGFASTKLTIEGRHDVCLCPRIVPVIEAMSAIALADLLLQAKTSKL